tara:strand:- start:86 stop:1279 length:1194 start_codon:yes stop_codon:yes gene_type:complete
MSIIRTQIARQLLAEGGMPMKKIKGQDHMLAYITPNEANKLVRLGGQKTMTPEGIPAYPEYDNYGYSSQEDFDAGNYGASSDPTVRGYDDKNLSDEDLKALSYAVKPTPKKTLREKIVDSIRGISRFSPTGIITRGLGSLFDKFGAFTRNMRGGLTQAQYEAARRNRINQNRIANILGRDAPFTAMTLENLAKLGYTGPLDKSLIGSTNITRSGTADDFYPDRAEGIVSQAPTTFRDAMAQLNLERGVPRDQVFLRAEDFIDPSKTISSEDLGTIQSRIEQVTGVPMGNIQLAKTFNTPEELENLGVLEDALFGGKKLTDQGKVLEDFRRSATKMRDAPKSPTYQQGVGSQFNRMLGMTGLMGDVIENRDFIQDAINKGFLAEPSDFQNQKPFEDIL